MGSQEIMAVSEECEVLLCSDNVKSCGSMGSINPEDILVLRNSGTSEERASLEPVTPDINGKCRDPLINLKPSITQLNEPDHLDSMIDINGDDESPCTPKGDVFDPFAPGSDDLLMAPQCKKRFDEWRTSVARRLNFGFSTKRSHDGNGTHISDEDMVETVYNNLLETILDSKFEDILAEMSGVEWADEDCRTPTSGPRLTGVAETCPGAPMKVAPKSRNIDFSLCRKLEF